MNQIYWNCLREFKASAISVNSSTMIETVNLSVVLIGLLGAVPFLVIAKRYGNRIPLALYTVLLLGTATVLGHPHVFRTSVAAHSIIAMTGLLFLWFTYSGHKQVDRVRAMLRKQGEVRVK